MGRIVASKHRDLKQHDPTFYANDMSYGAEAVGDSGRFIQWGMGLTLRGACRYRVNGRELRLEPGDLNIVRAATEIQWQVETGDAGWDVVFCIFDPRPHWLPWLQLPETVPGCTVLPLGDSALFFKLRRLLKSVAKLYGSPSPQRNEWAELMLERLLLTLQGYRSEQATDVRVSQAMTLLEREYARDWTVEELANACHLSASHLSFLFQETMGAAPMQYLEGVRMRRALAMLALGQASIAEIARDLGYAYPSYFARRFRRVTGQSPLEYRNGARPSGNA